MSRYNGQPWVKLSFILWLLKYFFYFRIFQVRDNCYTWTQGKLHRSLHLCLELCHVVIQAALVNYCTVQPWTSAAWITTWHSFIQRSGPRALLLALCEAKIFNSQPMKNNYDKECVVECYTERYQGPSQYDWRNGIPTMQVLLKGKI